MNPVIPDFTQPAAIQHARKPIPGCLVQNCTECCRISNPDGTPNLLGPLHQKQYTVVLADGNKLLDCARCPVHLSTFTTPAETADGRPIYWKGTNKQLTENQLIKLLEDDDCLELYVEVR